MSDVFLVGFLAVLMLPIICLAGGCKGLVILLMNGLCYACDTCDQARQITHIWIKESHPQGMKGGGGWL